MDKKHILAAALAGILLLSACGGPARDGGDAGDDGDKKQTQDDVREDASQTAAGIPIGVSCRTLACGWGFVCAGVLPDGAVVGADGEGVPLELPEAWTDITALDICDGVMAVVHEGGTVSSVNLKNKETREWDWTDAVDAAVFRRDVIALRRDGTVASSLSESSDANCRKIAQELEGWRDITAIGCGEYCVVGLRSDGSVLATAIPEAWSDYGQGDVGGWTDIVAIAAGDYHTVGLRSDGSVLACGYDVYGQLQVQDWTDIAVIAAGEAQTVGVKTDGTVVLAGMDEDAQTVRSWKDVVAVDAGICTAALLADGSVEVSRVYIDTSSWPALRLPEWYK